MRSDASKEVQCKLPGCTVRFVRKKPWQAFCCPEHRNAFHHGRVTGAELDKRIKDLELRVRELEAKVEQLMPDLN